MVLFADEINTYDFSGNMPERKASVTIEEEEIIERILEDFSGLELKKDYDIQNIYRDYQIEIVVTNQIKEKHFSTTIIRFDLDKNYVNDYQIVSETNHLKTIEYLVENDEIDWQDLNKD